MQCFFFLLLFRKFGTAAKKMFLELGQKIGKFPQTNDSNNSLFFHHKLQSIGPVTVERSSRDLPFENLSQLPLQLQAAKLR
jgi:hypothetical protein